MAGSKGIGAAPCARCRRLGPHTHRHREGWGPNGVHKGPPPSEGCRAPWGLRCRMASGTGSAPLPNKLSHSGLSPERDGPNWPEPPRWKEGGLGQHAGPA